MQVTASPSDLYTLLYDLDIRKIWDNSVIEFQELERLAEDVQQYYMLNKAPWPFTNRDFIETRYSRTKQNGDLEIIYHQSEHNLFTEVPEKTERGKTIFGGQIFREVQLGESKTLLVTLVSQAEMGGKIPPKAVKDTLPFTLLNWYKSVRKELLKSHEENLALL